MMTRSRRAFVLAAAVCAMVSNQPVVAGLNLDLRATSIMGAGTLLNSHAITGVSLGSIVHFDIYAVVRGTNTSTSDDRIISASGAIRSTANYSTGLRGDLSAEVLRSTIDPDTGQILVPGFDGQGFGDGMQRDLDGDGDLDIGSNNATASTAFWTARYALGSSGAPAGSSSWLTGGAKLGSGTFLVTYIQNDPLFTGAFVKFAGRDLPVAAEYIEDGVLVQSPTFPAAEFMYVESFTPEPSTALPMVVALIGFVWRRRPRI